MPLSCLAAEKAAPDEYTRTTARGNRGIVLADLGEVAEGRKRLNTAIAFARRTGNLASLGTYLQRLAEIELRVGGVDQTFELARESAKLDYRLGDLRELAGSLDVIAGVLIARGNAERAAHLLGAADAMLKETGTSPWVTGDHDPYAVVRAQAAAALGEQRYKELHAHGVGLTPDAALELIPNSVG